MNKLYISVITLFFTISSPILANHPKEIINEIFTITKNPKIESDESLQTKVNSYFSYSLMTKIILKNQLKKRSQKEIKWFQDTIEEIITKSVYPEAPSFFKNVTIEHEAPEKNKKLITILTIVTKRDEETEVQSTFTKIENSWKIIDISIDDESWTENIKEQVDKNIQQKGWSGLKNAMNKRLKEIKNESK